MGQAQQEKPDVGMRPGDRHGRDSVRVPASVVGGLCEAARERFGPDGVTDPAYRQSPTTFPCGQSKRDAP